MACVKAVSISRWRRHGQERRRHGAGGIRAGQTQLGRDTDHWFALPTGAGFVRLASVRRTRAVNGMKSNPRRHGCQLTARLFRGPGCIRLSVANPRCGRSGALRRNPLRSLATEYGKRPAAAVEQPICRGHMPPSGCLGGMGGVSRPWSGACRWRGGRRLGWGAPAPQAFEGRRRNSATRNSSRGGW
jgi:hypothetical protein